MDANLMQSMFEKSKNDRTGLTVFLPGQSISIVVTAIHGTGAIEGHNQQYDRVLIGTAEILGLASA